LLAAAAAPFGVAAALGVGAATYAGTALAGWWILRTSAEGRDDSAPASAGT
jgi:hypothetical protein